MKGLRVTKRIVFYAAAMLLIILISMHGGFFVFAEEKDDAQQEQTENRDGRGVDIFDKAVEYLNLSCNPDGSFKGSYPYNITAECCFILDVYSDADIDKSIGWLKNYIQAEINDVDLEEVGSSKSLNVESINSDALARYIRAVNDKELLNKLIMCQNSDGGFGLTDEYLSDVQDSLLVLEAINRVKDREFSESAKRLAEYLCWKMSENGIFSYVDGGKANLVLTARALYDLVEYKEIFGDKSKDSSEVIKLASKYIAENYYITFGSKLSEDMLYMALALKKAGEDYGQEELIGLLSDLQLENGSFDNDAHMTALVVWLLNEMNYSPNDGEIVSEDDTTNNSEDITDIEQDSNTEVETEGNSEDASDKDDEAEITDLTEASETLTVDEEKTVTEIETDELRSDASATVSEMDNTQKTADDMSNESDGSEAEADIKTGMEDISEDSLEDPKTSDDFNLLYVWIFILSGLAIAVIYKIKSRSEAGRK